jgi:hypothetical protein
MAHQRNQDRDNQHGGQNPYGQESLGRYCDHNDSQGRHRRIDQFDNDYDESRQSQLGEFDKKFNDWRKQRGGESRSSDGSNSGSLSGQTSGKSGSSSN